MKLCRDCDHYRMIRGHLGTYRMCHHPKNATASNDNPAVTTDYARAFYGACGVDGKLWEPIKPYERPTFWQRLFGTYDDNGRKLGA